jgi:hypothetical protein
VKLKPTFIWSLAGSVLLGLLVGCQPSRPPPEPIVIGWVAPEENEDGSQLTDLAGYRLYWGQSSGGPYPHSADLGNGIVVIDELDDGRWYFVMTAINADSTESRFSNEMDILVADGAPVRFEPHRLADRNVSQHP